MKIGIDCRLWSETGIGRYIRNLVKELQVVDKSNDYTLFILSQDKEKININNSRFETVSTDIKWHTLDEQIKLPEILNAQSLDLMHFPYFSVPFFYNRPFVVTIHDLIINHFSTGKASALPGPIYSLKRMVYKFILDQAAKDAKKIIAVSNATKSEIVDHLKIAEEKMVVIYEGVDEKIINSKLQIPNKLKIQKNKYFLYVGNAFPHKNLERLLEAFKKLSSEASLVLVGRDDYFYKRLKTKIEGMGLNKRVVVMENVTDEDLAGLYKNALALVMPSLMEGFGLPVLEAMANKCPVLASDIPSLEEICKDIAVYFDPYNVNDIAQKMKEIQAENSSLRIKEGVERAKDFSWEKMARETLGIYESCSSL